MPGAETMTCKHCGRDIARVFVGTIPTYGHLTHVSDGHYAVPKPAPESAEAAGGQRSAQGRTPAPLSRVAPE